MGTLKKVSSCLLVSICLTAATVSLPMKTLAESNDHAESKDHYQFQNVVTGGGGGYIPGIIFNPKQKDLIYMRTDVGGAYRWNPKTSSWIPLFDSVGWDDWDKMGVDALATDPVDPNKVYAAVGSYTNSWDPHNGYILRSDDQGKTWKETVLPFKVGGNEPGRGQGPRLVVDPNDNHVLYFGARSGNGLWKSTDSGVTWSKVNNFPNPGTYIPFPGQAYGGNPVGFSWIAFDPRTGTAGQPTQTIYAGVDDNTGNNIYRSTDGGETWAAVPGQPTGFLPHHGVLSSTGMLYISYSNGVGPYDGSKGDVWKLDTHTGTWTNISPVPSSDSGDYYGYGGLAVDPEHPDTLMVATLNSWWPDNNIYRSTDGGKTWSAAWQWGAYPNRNLKYTMNISSAPWLTMGAPYNLQQTAPSLGWMIDDIEIDPFNSDRMMYGTGATLYGTNNLTQWDTGGTVTISAMAKGVEETNVLGLISPPAGPHLVSAIGDITGFTHDDITKAPSMMFTNPYTPVTTSLDYAELKPNLIVRVGDSYSGSKNPSGKVLGISTDGGTTWNPDATEPPNASGGEIAVSADGSAFVWGGGASNSVYYTTDNGNTWSASQGVPGQAQVISDRVNPKKFYAYWAGKFYVSIDQGATFTQTATTDLPLNTAPGVGPTMSIKAMPGHEGDIWIAGGNTVEGKYGIWHSTDSGNSFTKLKKVEEADAIGFGKAAPGKDYMALYTIAKMDGQRGIFRSDNGGKSWVRVNDDQHQYGRPSNIIGDPRIYGRVYFATNGRGIIYGDPVKDRD
jgi:photosystem II stability/assembly factor-like uncharacterized protein